MSLTCTTQAVLMSVGAEYKEFLIMEDMFSYAFGALDGWLSGSLAQRVGQLDHGYSPRLDGNHPPHLP